VEFEIGVVRAVGVPDLLLETLQGGPRRPDGARLGEGERSVPGHGDGPVSPRVLRPLGAEGAEKVDAHFVPGAHHVPRISRRGVQGGEDRGGAAEEVRAEPGKAHEGILPRLTRGEELLQGSLDVQFLALGGDRRSLGSFTFGPCPRFRFGGFCFSTLRKGGERQLLPRSSGSRGGGTRSALRAGNGQKHHRAKKGAQTPSAKQAMGSHSRINTRFPRDRQRRWGTDRPTGAPRFRKKIKNGTKSITKIFSEMPPGVNRGPPRPPARAKRG